MARGNVSCTTNPASKRQAVCNKMQGVGDLELFAFSTSLAKVKAADRKRDANYVEVKSPTFGTMHFQVGIPAFPATHDDVAKVCCPFFCVTRAESNDGMNLNAKMSAKEVKFGDATVTVPTIVNTKKIAKGEMIVVHMPTPKATAKAKA